LIYDAFLVSDAVLTPDILSVAIALRLGVMTPFAIIMLIVLWFEPPVWLREGISALSMLTATASTLWLMLLSHAPYREGQHHTIILVILFATVVQRIRFPYAVVACLGCLAIHAAAMLALPEYPHELWVSADMILAGAAVLALVAAYSLERDSRLAYLDSLRRRQANRELAALSRHDPLTGLANRRALDEALDEMERTATADAHLSVLLFDIDHFKLYNDSAGHPAGDVCLKRIAGILRGELRDSGDLAYRFGGEEFLVLLPGSELAAAIAVAERVRRAVADAAIPHPALSGGAGIVTISAGAASAILGEGLKAAEIIAGADAALYAAKRNGRDQVWPPFLNARRSEIVELPDRKSRAKGG
jgi:diguanylate cyclase (GGDEF)-like protein